MLNVKRGGSTSSLLHLLRKVSLQQQLSLCLLEVVSSWQELVLSLGTVAQPRNTAFSGNPTVNSVLWLYFVYWSSAIEENKASKMCLLPHQCRASPTTCGTRWPFLFCYTAKGSLCYLGLRATDNLELLCRFCYCQWVSFLSIWNKMFV